MAKQSKEVVAGPVMSKPRVDPAERAKKVRAGWCKFQSKGRAYIEGAFLEDAEQEISLSPAASFRQRNNRNIVLLEGEVPVRESVTGETKEQAREADEIFLEDLEDGDPRVGPAPGGLKLIKQG